MEPGSTLSQRSSSESTDFDVTRTQTCDLESARPLLRPTLSTTRDKSDKGRTPETRQATSVGDEDEVLVVKGRRIGRGTILCGVLLAFFT